MSFQRFACAMLGGSVLALAAVGMSAVTASAAESHPAHVHTMSASACLSTVADAVLSLRSTATDIATGDPTNVLSDLNNAQNDLTAVAQNCVNQSATACVALSNQALQNLQSAITLLVGSSPDVADAFTAVSAAGGYAALLQGSGCIALF